MTNDCRMVLKNFRLIVQGEENELCFLDCTTEIALFNDYDVFYNYKKYSGEIHGIIDVLVSEGFLRYGQSQDRFFVTYKGLHPYKMQWESLKHFLLVSVVIPVTVSFFTALLTLWLKTL